MELFFIVDELKIKYKINIPDLKDIIYFKI